MRTRILFCGGGSTVSEVHRVYIGVEPVLLFAMFTVFTVEFRVSGVAEG